MSWSGLKGESEFDEAKYYNDCGWIDHGLPCHHAYIHSKDPDSWGVICVSPVVWPIAFPNAISYLSSLVLLFLHYFCLKSLL